MLLNSSTVKFHYFSITKYSFSFFLLFKFLKKPLICNILLYMLYYNMLYVNFYHFFIIS